MQRYRERYRNEFCQFGRAAGWKGAAGAGQRKAGTGGADSGKGMEWFFVPASGNGFSKYSGKRVSIVRNRARFAIRAHCALLVTSVSPNCCLLNGILRKSHFPSQSSWNPRAACPIPIPPGIPSGTAWTRPATPRPLKLISVAKYPFILHFSGNNV